jgi:two-component system sensor histidine kinase NblS
VLLNIKFLISSINRFWLNFKLQTQLLISAVALISLLISTTTSWTLENFSVENQITKQYFNHDVGFLLGANIVSFLVGIIFNTITIKKPIKDLTIGIKNVADGNFDQNLNIPTRTELRNLVTNFNEMGKKLQKYDEKNIDQLVGEKNKLESLIFTIADGALLLDINLKIILANSAAVKIFNWNKKKEIIGTFIWEHFSPNLQKKLLLGLSEMVRTSRSVLFYGELEKKSTPITTKFICIILNIVYDYQGSNKRPIGIAVTIQDNTKELEFNKTRNRFMSNISHELRTPLFNIRSFIETTQEYNYTLSNKQKKYFLSIATNETNRLTRLVNDILDLARLDTNQKKSLTYLDLSKVIVNVTKNYNLVAKEKIITLTNELPRKQIITVGNSDLLLQLFINIIANSLKFTHKKGEIIIRSCILVKEKKVRIEIIDTGIGLLTNHKEVIFQRFYRVENDTHTIKGTGLGLSIVKTILLQHNSNINVISKYKVGSIFWFELDYYTRE